MPTDSMNRDWNQKLLALITSQGRGFWPALQRWGLWALSVPYGWAARCRNRLYEWGWKRSWQASVPVVSVGNLTVGGTGKTPCVEFVARFYRELDLQVAILSRGYGSTGGCNDEALVLEENLPDVPHLQGADRVALAATAVEELESEILVLDDGFQHRRLARNLDIVLVDATQPWGYGFLLPRGLLREAPSGLRRSDLIMLTRCDQVDEGQKSRLREEIHKVAPGKPVVETVHGPVALIQSDGQTAPLEMLRDRPVLAFCGIGNPRAFRRTLETLGAKVIAFRTFPDHHAYDRTDVEDLRNWVRQQATDCLVLTTQKDLVKLRLARLGGRDLWAIQVRLHVTSGQDALDRMLRSVVTAPRHAES
jgi:tetraacyldisaccharide 4'-kinase